ncbi:hypothetical protein DENSPDRAFT_858352 [Dentipellis sp. KUC8613]|nr:hypothetical protein DENSPDRAFT_858352 [Dentipellis sp. KUC8613]
MNDATAASIVQGAKLDKQTCDYADWEDLKRLFAKAAEEYERDDLSGAISLLRAVINECVRFFKFYHDPSVLFTHPIKHSGSSPESFTPPEERLQRDWGSTEKRRRKSDSTSSSHRTKEEPSPSYTELPTAFHAILGITLFLYGNLIAQESSLAFQGEPDTPIAYWLCALDVFEAAENLPSRTNGSMGDAEDWRMAIVWGRTLVCLADEKVNLKPQAAPSSPFAPRLPTEEPQWPTDSPFRVIASRRPPVTRRMTLSSATANDIMVQAMDQFSRGIFHMPHPQQGHIVSSIFTRGSPSRVTPQTLIPSSPDSFAFSRPKELYTIASEVLGVAERLEEPDERRYWASWADSVFNQMKMEADMDEWRARVVTARGRCWLIAGSARVDELEEALEAGRTDVLLSKEADEAREGLRMAITFFDRAKGSASTSRNKRDLEDLQMLLAEALLSLANLTTDENTREELYSRAQAEGGESVVAALRSDNASTSSRQDDVEYMDES